MKTKITVVGSGYVGMSLAVLLAKDNEVKILDIDAERIEKINNSQSAIVDKDITQYLSIERLSLSATLDEEIAYKGSDFIIATPTNYDVDTNQFDTGTVDGVVEAALKKNSEALVIIKSTVPVGYTKSLQEKFKTSRVIFSPEFLREGQALRDNLYPSRIIVGSNCDLGVKFAHLLKQASNKKEVDILFMRSTKLVLNCLLILT